MYVNIYGVSKNEYETKLVKELYSGDNGQIFQMMQFFYFCNALYDIDELNNFFEQMFEDCKNNSQILAKILFKNSEEPSYISSKNIPISGINFEYYKGIKNILNYTLEIKEKSIINYKIVLNKINQKNIKKSLENILICEQNHKQIIGNLIKKYVD